MAITLTLTRPVTDEELLELSRRNPGYQFERNAQGELIVTPTGSKSGNRSARVMQQLANWADRHGGGLVFDSSTGFKLPDGSVRSPDVSWVWQERWDALTEAEQEGFAPLCPDAVFEIASPSDDLSELQEKMQVYLANGARVGVLVVPQNQTVEVYRPGLSQQVLSGPRFVALDPELPGFVLDLVPIFEV